MSFLSISIIIPVFNEEKRLPKTFSALEYFLNDHTFSDVEIIFVDDGSSDKTAEMVRNFKFRYPVKLISYSKNRGKGYAVRQGMLSSSKNYSLMLDADMSTPFSELHKLIPLMQQRCPVIIGTRKAQGSKVTERQSWYRKKLGEGYTLLARLITGVWVSDFTCGFKCFSKAAVDKIFPLAKIDRWSYDAEILFLAKKFGFQICEVPVVWQNDRHTKVRLGRDIFGSFLDLVRLRLRRK